MTLQSGFCTENFRNDIKPRFSPGSFSKIGAYPRKYSEITKKMGFKPSKYFEMNVKWEFIPQKFPN